MKKIFVFLILLIISIMLISCNDSNEKVIPAIKEVNNEKLEELLQDNTLIDVSEMFYEAVINENYEEFNKFSFSKEMDEELGDKKEYLEQINKHFKLNLIKEKGNFSLSIIEGYIVF